MPTVKEVSSILNDCFFKDNEINDGKPKGDCIEVRGVVTHMGLHPGRVAENKTKIRKLLDQLPEKFHEETGGGFTFLNACQDNFGKQWGEQLDVDKLICLGLATKDVEFCMPRDMWKALPGGVPYFMIKKKQV